MAWLRLDDGFTANSKIAQLSDAEFRAWMRLLCHCARSRDPSVDEVAIREVSGLNSRRIRRYADLGLLDEVGAHFEVHDWTKYMPKEEQNAARQAKWRARHRNALSNAGSNAGGDAEVTPSHARGHARGPVPSRPQELSSTPTNHKDVADDDPEPPAVTFPVAEIEEVLRSV